MRPDRIFLDANILFSTAYGSLGLERLWRFSKKGQCILLASQYVIEEAKRNLIEPAQLAKLHNLLEHVQIVAEIDPTIVCPVGLPEKDRPVLMAAIAAKANYLLTGDVTHFGEYFGKSIMGVTISLPRDYVTSQ